MHPDVQPLTADSPLVHRLIEAAGRAPSLHNTQPWLFTVRRGALELRIDPSRALRTTDPQARELTISCGAALFNIRVALRRESLEPVVELRPDGRQPLVLARVHAVRGQPPERDEQRLADAIMHRHSRRHGFDARTLNPNLAHGLERAAAAEGARLQWLDASHELELVSRLVRSSHTTFRSNLALRRETEAWIGRPRESRDGVPASSLRIPRGRSGLPPRDFVTPTTGQPRHPGRVALLTTPNDGIDDWLTAGQGLEHLLLRAAIEWAFASYSTGPLELPFLRRQLAEGLQVDGHPQMLFEVGYASDAPATPRRHDAHRGPAAEGSSKTPVTPIPHPRTARDQGPARTGPPSLTGST